MTQLRRLLVYETPVTAAGLSAIAELPSLTQLTISPDQISADELDDLKRRHPKLNIAVMTADPEGSGFSRRKRNRSSPHP